MAIKKQQKQTKREELMIKILNKENEKRNRYDRKPIQHNTENTTTENENQDKIIDPNKIVNTDIIPTQLELKPEFEIRYKHLLGDRYDSFINSSKTYIKKAIRVNTLKIGVEDMRKRLSKEWKLEQVPWCKEGFWVEYKSNETKRIRYDIGNVPEHQMGFIYVQDPASMIPPVVLNPKPGDIVLDMCASPGSKTTQMAQYMNNEGIIIANEFQGKRLPALGLNLQRCGVYNTVITQMDGSRINEILFDKILLDAPCSGTGTIRRNFKTAQMWSHNLVSRMVHDQFMLLNHAFSLLKEGGVMVYSTCTLEPEENEGNVSKLLEKFPQADLLDIELNINRSPAVVEFEGKKYDERVKKCLRIYPQDNDSEGFFVAKITKRKLD